MSRLIESAKQAATNKLLLPAQKVAKALAPLSSGKLPQEIIVLSDDMVSVVVEIEGVDYIMTMQRVPRQRPKPTIQ